MTELSNAVTVLIARMESHPEDFELYSSKHRAKFAQTAEALYGLVGMDKEKAGAYWFLTDADKEALIEAWKKYHRTAMEKEVMERIFDDGAEEREAEVKRLQAQQRAHINAQMAAIGASTGTYQTTTIKPGQLSPLHHNAAQSGYQGLLGSAGNAGLLGGLTGIFK